MKPNPILAFLIVVVRLYILTKIVTLLIQTSIWPEVYPISLLTWWIYFLVFDIWVMSLLPTAEEIKTIQEDEERKE